MRGIIFFFCYSKMIYFGIVGGTDIESPYSNISFKSFLLLPEKTSAWKYYRQTFFLRQTHRLLVKFLDLADKPAFSSVVTIPFGITLHPRRHKCIVPFKSNTYEYGIRFKRARSAAADLLRIHFAHGDGVYEQTGIVPSWSTRTDSGSPQSGACSCAVRDDPSIPWR